MPGGIHFVRRAGTVNCQYRIVVFININTDGHGCTIACFCDDVNAKLINGSSVSTTSERNTRTNLQIIYIAEVIYTFAANSDAGNRDRLVCVGKGPLRHVTSKRTIYFVTLRIAEVITGDRTNGDGLAFGNVDAAANRYINITRVDADVDISVVTNYQTAYSGEIHRFSIGLFHIAGNNLRIAEHNIASNRNCGARYLFVVDTIAATIPESTTIHFQAVDRTIAQADVTNFLVLRADNNLAFKRRGSPGRTANVNRTYSVKRCGTCRSTDNLIIGAFICTSANGDIARIGRIHLNPAVLQRDVFVVAVAIVIEVTIFDNYIAKAVFAVGNDITAIGDLQRVVAAAPVGVMPAHGNFCTSSVNRHGLTVSNAATGPGYLGAVGDRNITTIVDVSGAEGGIVNNQRFQIRSSCFIS